MRPAERTTEGPAGAGDLAPVGIDVLRQLFAQLGARVHLTAFVPERAERQVPGHPAWDYGRVLARLVDRAAEASGGRILTRTHWAGLPAGRLEDPRLSRALPEAARRFGIEALPAVVIWRRGPRARVPRIHVYGVPAGLLDLPALAASVLAVGGVALPGLSLTSRTRLAAVRQPVRVEVFTSPT